MKRRLILALSLALLAPSYERAHAEDPVGERAELPDWRGIWFVENAAPGINGYAPPPQPLDPYVLLRIFEMPLNDAGRARLQVMGSLQAAGKSVSWGYPMMMSGSSPLQFLITPDETIMLNMDRDVRHIHTDGRSLPAEEDRWPTVWGESVGHWEGDTLVIETVSVEEPIKYFFASPPLSAQARYVERIRLVAPGRIENEMTIEDPGALSAPWTVRIVYLRTEGLDRLVHDDFTNDRTRPDGNVLAILPPQEASGPSDYERAGGAVPAISGFAGASTNSTR